MSLKTNSSKENFHKTKYSYSICITYVIFAVMIEELNPQDNGDQDLFEHLRIVVDKGQALLRIDKFLITGLKMLREIGFKMQ